MLPFPPVWEVLDLSQFEAMKPDIPAGQGLFINIFTVVQPASGQKGSFHVVLGSNNPVSISFSAEKMIPHKSMEGFTIKGEFDVDDKLRFPLNTLATKWVEARDLIAARDLTITDQHEEEAAEEFLEKLKAGRLSKAPLAASIRWMVAVTEGSNMLELQLQALPCSKKNLKHILRQEYNFANSSFI